MNTDYNSNGNIIHYLKQHEQKELLRFVTVGSVDDGKSTLIGRLLYETQGVYEDQLNAVRKNDKDGAEEIDFALLTDGLRSEQEQGITIDVAYRYFSTAKRKFIIADTPGHVQYTRNMATGASTADIAVILIDARLGVLQQSRRHAFIASLLGIPKLVVAVNKMDLIAYKEDIFNEIVTDFTTFSKGLGFAEVVHFPISALKGDNIVQPSDKTEWFKSGTILDYLENTPIVRRNKTTDFTMPVQYVQRPNLDFRGYSGTITSGTIQKGETVETLPSGKRSKVTGIVTYDGEMDGAFEDQAVTITLDDELDISRGDMLTKPGSGLQVINEIIADVVWMSETPLVKGKQYWIKQTTRTVTAVVESIEYKFDMDTLEEQEADRLELNEIGRVTIKLSRPLVIDLYKTNKYLGAFIVIDRSSNLTLGAGMVATFPKKKVHNMQQLVHGYEREERAKKFNQVPALIWFTGLPGSAKTIIARALERHLFEAGHLPYVIELSKLRNIDRNVSGEGLDTVLNFVDVVLDSGCISISAFTAPLVEDRERVKERFGDDNLIEIYTRCRLETCRTRLKQFDRDPEKASLLYEEPRNPEVVIDTDTLDVDDAVQRIVEILHERKVIF